LRVLANCDLIAAEDTRRIRKLLNHFDISVKVISYREQNHAKVLPRISSVIAAGGSVALVSDAGMPCISDPGAELVVMAGESGIPVHVIPGPSAVTTAMALSGYLGEEFIYLGFPDRKTGRRNELFRKYGNLDCALLIYEAPHRIIATLKDLLSSLGDREIRIFRELTKLHEEVISGKISAVLKDLKARESIKGEITMVVFPATGDQGPGLTDEEITVLYRERLKQGQNPNEILKDLAQESGRKKRELYSMLRLK
jgi:16S rRNA (cytidine1402-2'-O)-methyltransferase